MRLIGSNSYPAKLTEDRLDLLMHDTSSPKRVEVRPYTDTDGLHGEGELISDIADRMGTGKGAGTFSIEWWFRDQLTLQFTGPDLADIQSLINSQYPNSRLETYEEPLPEGRVGQYIGCAVYETSASSIYPLAALGGKNHSPDTDPYSSTLPRFVNERGVKTVVQASATPIKGSWYTDQTYRYDGNTVAGWAGNRGGDYFDGKKKDIEDQKGSDAFQTTIRAVAIGDTPEEVNDALESVSSGFEKFDYGDEQQIRPNYCKQSSAIDEAREAVRRRVDWPNKIRQKLWGYTNALTREELWLMFHIPNDEINVADVKWATRESGPGVPRESEEFDDDMDIPGVPSQASDLA